MKFKYNKSDDVTKVVLNGEVCGELTGQVTYMRGDIPHPDSDTFDEFVDIVRQMNAPDERELFLHLLAGNVSREGFTDDG